MTTAYRATRNRLSATAALSALAISGAGLATLVVPTTSVAAQDYSQVNATGRVQGTDEQPIPNATVVVTSEEQGFSRTVTTDTNGSYRVPALPAGPYSFTVSAPGFDSFTDTGVLLSQSGAANLFTLAPEGAVAGNAIVIVGRRQVADFDRNTTGAVINVGELALRVPVERDITSVVLLSPGTSQGDSAFGNLPSINGSSVSENAYYINGLNITSFRNGLGSVPVPFDFYQTIEVKNGGIPAEFGRTTGGFINAITKSGSNDYHGSVTFNWQPQDLSERAPNSYNNDRDSIESDRIDFIAQLSGPIIKDHLFFYGIYNARDVTLRQGFTGTSSLTTTGANACSSNPTQCADFADLRDANLAIAGTQFIDQRNSSPFYGGKLDAVIVDGQRLEATYFNTKGTTNRDVYGTGLFSLASGLRYNPNTNDRGGYASSLALRSGGENYVFRYTGTFTDWLTVSGAYGKYKNRDTVESSTPNLPSIVDQRNGANAPIGNPTANANLSFEKREFYRADADVNFELAGSHHIRFGYDREDLDLNGTIVANGGFQITLATAAGDGIDTVTGLPTGTNYAKARTFVSGGEFNTRNEAFYAQDSWSLLNDRLQLNLGVRADKFVNRNAAGESFYDSDYQFAPRVGASFDVFGDQSTKAYGSFSRYYLPIAANTNLRLAGSELDYDAFFRLNGLNADGTPNLGAPITTGAGFTVCPPGGPAGTACNVRNDGTVSPTATTVASNLTPQSTDEYILGAERRFGDRIKLGAFLTYTSLNESLEDGAIDQGVIPLCVAAGNSAEDCGDLYFGLNQYVLFNPGSDVVVQAASPFPNQDTAQVITVAAEDLGYPRAKRTYKAATIVFEREFDGIWSLNANYTYSKNKGNIEGGVRSDNGQTDSGLTSSFDLPALTAGSYGYLPNDRRHNLKVYGSYQVLDWLTLGANAQVASPRRYGCIGRTPATADGNAIFPGGLAGRFYGADAFYCNLDGAGNVVRNPVGFSVINDRVDVPGGARPSTLQLTPRASQFKSDWLYNLNLDIEAKVPSDAFDAFFRVTVINVLNRKAELDYNEFGTVDGGAPNATYSLPTGYQDPRSIRLQFRVGF